jgi:hypothetical protein
MSDTPQKSLGDALGDAARDALWSGAFFRFCFSFLCLFGFSLVLANLPLNKVT